MDVAALLLTTGAILLVPLRTTSETIKDNPYLDSTKLRLFVEVQGYLYNEHFELADSTSSILIRLYPDDPSGFCFRAMGVLNQMFDSEENLFGDKFKALSDTAESLAKEGRKRSTGERAAWMCMWIGHAKANRALWESKFGSAARAVRLGLQAGGEYRDGLRHDSTITDIFAGLGAFHYWKSEKAGLLRMIRIFNDDRKQGIAELYKAARESKFSRAAARHALAWIYANEDAPDSVSAICGELRKQYPDGKVFLWPIAESMKKCGRQQEALSVFSQLQQLIALQPGNYYNLIECESTIFRCQVSLGLDNDAEITALRVGTYAPQIPERTSERQKGKLRELSRYLAERGQSVAASAP